MTYFYQLFTSSLSSILCDIHQHLFMITITLFKVHCPLVAMGNGCCSIGCHYVIVLYIYCTTYILLKLQEFCNQKMSVSIPPDLRIMLLPSPTLSVTEFLQFPLPTQTQIHPLNISLYWCNAEPNIMQITLHDLKDLLIPSTIILGKLVKQTNQLEQSGSICYSHLPSSGLQFPLWVLTYWVEVSHLQQHV